MSNRVDYRFDSAAQKLLEAWLKHDRDLYWKVPPIPWRSFWTGNIAAWRVVGPAGETTAFRSIVNSQFWGHVYRRNYQHALGWRRRSDFKMRRGVVRSLETHRRIWWELGTKEVWERLAATLASTDVIGYSTSFPRQMTTWLHDGMQDASCRTLL